MARSHGAHPVGEIVDLFGFRTQVPDAPGPPPLLAPPSINLPMFTYRTILADPPWLYENWSEAGEAKSPQAQYDCLDLDLIKRMRVADLAHPDGCVLLMWATAPMVPQALGVIEAWGFTYSSMAAWAKQSKTGRTWAFGTGHRFRSAMEPLILATMNDPPLLSRSVRNLIVAPVREHSRKPECIYDVAEAIGAGPRCELFARQQRHGWAAWGNQTDKFTAPAGA